EFRLDTDGDLTISGDLVTGGSGNCAPPNPACDGVFLPDYNLLAIQEHAEAMWENKYLPAIGPTRVGMPINVNQKVAGILNELETAHIYIEQLNNTLGEKETEIVDLEARLTTLEQAMGVRPASFFWTILPWLLVGVLLLVVVGALGMGLYVAKRSR
ncbi:MAG: hypothetical protein GY832_23425, partial [Chloroflexi bacterium]|nr:hypothetical protein [Chloroflexota bacterium]